MSDTEPVRWQTYRIPIATELLSTADAFRAALDAEMESMLRAIHADAQLTLAERSARLAQWDAERPQRVRRNILANLADAMPGKRHGAFTRAGAR